MYGSMPYIFPNQIMQAAPLNAGLTGAANLGNSINSIGTAKTGLAGFLSKINLSSILTRLFQLVNKKSIIFLNVYKGL